ncbi:PAS domain-containing protein [Duganella sp. FT80W]|uniref:PAS domain-containing protein n=1 Tax=Duganella guangzhouensis TaxID=2666084 RepID=A0A6I2L7H0_9BURK|nr:PAS domain-containing protein [Duganella guangzhouensis]MRW94098.1 PAS domain-containing protein [Duganella guangzhouensis]
MTKRSRPELNPGQLREMAERAVSALPPEGADSDQLRYWHEMQVNQIELDLQQEALAELRSERDEADTMHQRYAALYDQAPAGYLSLNHDGVIVRANLAACELVQCDRDALIGKRFEQFVAPQAQAGLRRFLSYVGESGARAVMEAPLFDGQTADGASTLRRVHIEANLDEASATCRMILTDIGSADLRDAVRLRAMRVLDSINEGVLVCDVDHNIVSVNHAFTTLTGYPVEEALGRNPRFLGRRENHPPGYFADAMRQLRTAGRWAGDVFNSRQDGTPYTAHMSLTVIRDDNGAISYFIGVFSDVTAQREVEAAQLRWSQELDARVAARTVELSESREQLRKLAAHQEQIKEEERKRIARDIHDELGQNLLALRIDMSMLSARTAGRQGLLHQRVNAALENVDATIRSVRGIMNELRPPVLDLGLAAALEWQAAEFRKRSGLACGLTLPDEAACATLHSNVATTLFRAVQEALSNVRRHALASRVDIVLAVADGRLTLSIADDGVGMAPEAASRAGIHSFGLIGMAQRVAALGGTLDIDYARQAQGGKGCRLTLGFDL